MRQRKVKNDSKDNKKNARSSPIEEDDDSSLPTDHVVLPPFDDLPPLPTPVTLLSPPKQWQHISWKMWSLLAIVRIVVSTLPLGYVHPDEHFQSVEIAAKQVFGYQVFTPWEFEFNFEIGQPPIRSILFP